MQLRPVRTREYYPCVVHRQSTVFPIIYRLTTAYLALWREHVWRELQIHHLGHLGPAIGGASPPAATDVIPGAEHAVRVLRARTHEQLHRKPVRWRGAQPRRCTRDGNPQLEARDQPRSYIGRVAQGTVPPPWAVDTLGRRDRPRHDVRALWCRARATS